MKEGNFRIVIYYMKSTFNSENLKEGVEEKEALVVIFVIITVTSHK